MSRIRSLDIETRNESRSQSRGSASSVLVTLADQAYVEQAKQLFSSAYFDGGWRGDYLLLAHEIDEEELEWFVERGVLVRRCEPLYEGSFGGMPPVVTSKLYLFTPEFRKWHTVVFCDADATICSSLDGLTTLKGFWSIQDASTWLERQVVSAESIEERGIDPALYKKFVRAIRRRSPLRTPLRTPLHRPCFCSGFFAFTTDIISDSVFGKLKETMDRFEPISQYGEQLIFNLVFARTWRQLPPAYNMQVTGEENQWGLSPEEIDAIVLHYITADKPWLSRNAFYERWQRNLARADGIDVSAVPEVEPWSEQKVAGHTAYLRGFEDVPIPARRRLRWWLGGQAHRVPGLHPLHRLVRGLAGRVKKALKASLLSGTIKSQPPVTASNYLVCTTHRSGSSWLSSLLCNTSVAGMRPDPVVNWEYLREVVGWDAPDVPLREADLTRIFKDAFARARTDNGVSGFKVMWSMIDQLARRMPSMRDTMELSRRLPEFLPKGTRYIWLTRRDTVRQAVSWAKSIQSDAWNSRTEASLESTFEFRFDQHMIRRRHEEIRSNNRQWRRFFSHNEIRPLRIVYEEMVEHPEATVRAILDHLGVPAPPRLAVGGDLDRQSSEVNEEWVRRFRDTAAPRGTLTRRRLADERYPDFLFIGAQRAGTTWLTETLRFHPEVWLPPRKELHYFDRSPDYPSVRTHAEHSPFRRLAYGDFRGWLLGMITTHYRQRRWDFVRWELRYSFGRWDDAWYASLFRDATGMTTGDTTPDYSMLTAPDVRKVAALMPDAKVVFVLRNPIERAWSALRYNFGEPLTNGTLSLGQMKEYVDSPAQELRSDYLRTIKHWSAAFPSEQLHIAFFDDLVSQPAVFAESILRFLGVTEKPPRWKLYPAPVNASITHKIPDELRDYLAKKYVDPLEELAERFGPPSRWLDDAMRSKTAQ